MRRFFWLLIFILLSATSSFSQSRLSVVGFVSDTTGKRPVEFATVVLLSSRDSSIVSSALADVNGVFELRNVAPGRYLVKVSQMSFSSTIKRINARGASGLYNVGNIRMVRKQIALGEVVITGKSTPVRVAKDTIEFNAGAYKPREQDMVADVLRKLPGVTVDKDGAVTINGKPVTQIMVDGKKFFLNDPSLATQNLPADIIDKIQVVNKKSDQAEFTKIDDGNTEKVINLTLKKDKKRGVFGSYRAGVGTRDAYDVGARTGGFENATQLVAFGGYNNINRHGGGSGAAFPNASKQGIVTIGNAAVNLNYEPSERLHANGSYRFGYSSTDKDASANRQNYDTRGTFNSDSHTEGNSISRSHSLYSRVEYAADTTLSVIISPNVQMSGGDSHDGSRSHLFDTNGALVNSEERTSSRKSSSETYGLAVLLQKKLAKPRKTLSLDVDGKLSNSSSDDFILQKNYYAAKDSTNIRNQSVDASGRKASLGTNLAYTHPLGKYLTAELSYQLNATSNRSTNAAFDFNPSTKRYDMANGMYSKRYKNEEYKNAAGVFLNFSNGWLVVNLGANANIISQDYHNRMGVAWLDTSVVYRNISPSALVSLSSGEGSDLSFSYSGNTRQPGVEQLHPIQNPNTPNSIYLANPLLKEEFGHSFSLSYSYFNKVSFLSFSNNLGYSFTQEAIASKSYRDELGKYYQQAVNVDGQYSVSNFTTIAKSMFTNMLHLSASVNTGYNHTPSFFNQVKYFANQTTLGETLKAYLTLESVEVGANCGYSTNWASYDGLAANASATKESSRYSTLSFGGDMTVRLPAGFVVKSTIEASRKQGSRNAGGESSYLWNGALTKMFLKDRSLALTVLAFDILDKFRPFSRTVTASYIEEARYKAMSQLFMVSLSYNLNRFGGAAKGR
ncbi:outer membrane beta-barrel protein [uncultured Acetobacteroides sp.]|uniref:outer membrane beta-barrel protein n=1 Tax=uncultured Acetobacteroides sp. TaxID=1760811 RepID=UPI0029F55282|nr:outer membrane beta-barrel protein [uncultured Acetobacteroides sp.]